MPVLRRVRPALWIAVGLCVALPVSASGAVTIGETDNTGIASCNPDATWVQDSTAATSPSYTVPAGGGVITSWQHDAAVTGSTMRLKVFRKTAANEYLTVGHSALQQLTIAGLNTYRTRVTAQGGDLLGIRLEDGMTRCREGGVGGDLARAGLGLDPPLGSPVAFGSEEASTINVTATVEPDADADGFGDETQDRCPTDASSQGTCPPDTTAPETTITRGAPKTTDKSKIKLKFTSSEPDSTFQCKLKAKPSVGKRHTRPAKFKSCESPRKLKNLGTGTNKFQVRAIDAAGNVDPTPAKDKFKVVS